MAQPLIQPSVHSVAVRQVSDGLEPQSAHSVGRFLRRSVAGVPRNAWRLDDDGRPVWACGEGDELRPGVRAWQRLGVGLRCETWLAWATHGCCPVVVKLPRPHQVQHPRAWASLTREVYVLTRAHHPALPQLYENQLDTDVPYLVLEYLDGPTLDGELEAAGPMPASAAALLATHLLSALTAVHATGAAHLDVKPENVVIRDGRPVLIDFGSARPLGSPQPAGRPVGTEGYAAPEMEACEPIAAAMDVYGVGRILSEALGLRHRTTAGPALAVHPRRGLRYRISRIAERLSDPDPDARPTVTEGLELLAAAVGPGRLWPAWVDVSERRSPA